MQPSNASTFVEVTADQLPISCPMPNTTAWDSHPRVYIPLEDSPEASCSYCGTVYRLIDKKVGASIAPDPSAGGADPAGPEGDAGRA